MERPSPRRPYHQTQPSIISDYEESDTNNNTYLSDIATAPPPPAERTDAQLNLSVLQRHNHDVVTLEYVAPYAVVYVFSPETQAWEKSGIEGTAFLCGLRPRPGPGLGPGAGLGPPRFSVLVLNRRGLDNFQLELLAAADVEITEEYVILQSSEEEAPDGRLAVYGLWVFSEPAPSSTAQHRANMALRIQQCAELVEQGRRATAEEQIAAGAYNGQDAGIEDEEGEEEEEEEVTVPMGRQVSLKELFGQQRQRDDAWSIRSHSRSRPASKHSDPAQSRPRQAPLPPQPQFTTTADTDFFRTARPKVASPSLGTAPALPAGSTGQRQILLDLFRKAGDDYRGSR